MLGKVLGISPHACRTPTQDRITPEPNGRLFSINFPDLVRGRVLTLGRLKSSALVLNDSSVSLQHARSAVVHGLRFADGPPIGGCFVFPQPASKGSGWSGCTRRRTGLTALPVVVCRTIGDGGANGELLRVTWIDPTALAARLGLVVRAGVELNRTLAGVPGRDLHRVVIRADVGHLHARRRRAGRRGVLVSFRQPDRRNEPNHHRRGKTRHTYSPRTAQFTQLDSRAVSTLGKRRRTRVGAGRQVQVIRELELGELTYYRCTDLRRWGGVA
jgi:hypothetical protein